MKLNSKKTSPEVHPIHIGIFIVAALAAIYGVLALATLPGCVSEIERQKPVDEDLGVEGTETDPTCEVADNGTGAPLCPIDTTSPIGPGTDRTPPKASLSITSVPAGAKIYIDGVEARDPEDSLEVTPSELKVILGNHRVELKYPERYQFVPEGTEPVLNVPTAGAEAHYELYCEVEGFAWWSVEGSSVHDYLTSGEADGMPTVENIPGTIKGVCMTSANSGTVCPSAAASFADEQVTVTFKHDCSAFTIHVYNSWSNAEYEYSFEKME